MKNKKNKKFGFTLGEVLIAMTIVGMIFLISIPALQNSTASREKHSQLMKIYPIMDNLINLIVLEHMKVENVPFGEKDGFGNDEFSKLLVKRMRVGEDCQNSQTETGHTGCWADETFNKINFNKDNDFYKFRLVDGTSLAVQTFKDCKSIYNVDDAYTYKNVCAVIYVDVNSFDPPNKWGEDVFNFVYTKDRGLQPASKEAVSIVESPKESVKK